MHGNKRARECRVCALKRCEFKDSAPDVVEGYKSEVKLLRDLRNKPGIVQMIDWQIWEEPGILFILMEAGETTLDILLQSHKRLQKEWGCSSPDWCFIGFKWKEMVHVSSIWPVYFAEGSSRLLYFAGALHLEHGSHFSSVSDGLATKTEQQNACYAVFRRFG